MGKKKPAQAVAPPLTLAQQQGADGDGALVPEATVVAYIVALKRKHADFGIKRILRHIEENPPGWTITERRLTKIMKKHSLTTRTDAPAVLVPEAPAARAGGSTAGARRPRRVARQRGLAFSQAREQFALQLEVERFFVDRSFSQADAEQLSWMVLQEDETSWLETLVANPHYLNDGRLERVLRDSIAAMEFTNMALAQQLYSALRVFEAILRDGPVSYVVA